MTRDPNGSKPFARGATALGVAVALGEVSETEFSDAAIAQRLDLFSSVANTSAGGELRNCEVLLFGNSERAGGDLRIGHAMLGDVVDSEAVRSAVMNASGSSDAAIDPERIVAIFAKAEAPPSGMLRGRRTTMLSDADINYERHARAALGAVITSVTGDAAIFVSGGTEHQCKPGEAPIARRACASERKANPATNFRTTVLERRGAPMQNTTAVGLLRASATVLSACAILVAASAAEAEDKAAILLPGSANDQSWNALGYSILQEPRAARLQDRLFGERLGRRRRPRRCATTPARAMRSSWAIPAASSRRWSRSRRNFRRPSSSR